ncbi:hemocyte protein-glutamine gamma-glutamyltransferase-like [Argopecten irradians]|uniref:hemocyte protein-glutamine gamma-glutamyltransferase-like n=1 Tax=Argopecten irradians TaxID=31199 RepID=UPI003722ED85
MAGTMKGLYGQLEESKDVIVKIADKKRVAYGDDLEVEVNFENLSNEDRTISGTWSLQSYYSTGVFAHRVRSERIEMTLNPAQKIPKKMRLSFDEYNSKTVEGCYFKTLCVCTVRDTKQVASLDRNIRLIKPDLHLQAPAEVREGDRFKVTVTFKNPLPISLTQCSLEIEAPGLLKPKTFKLGSVAAKMSFTHEVVMTASKLGTRTVVANFDSKELVGINGSCEVVVKAE